MQPVFRSVVLTGGIATGKSYCLHRFALLGAPTIDADDLARRAVAPGTDGHAAVIARFGHEMVTADGAIDRDALGRLVFADPQVRRDLEAIVHPRVYAAIHGWFESQRQQAAGAEPDTSHAAIADIPLVFETGHASDFDVLIVAACRPDQQLARLMARDGLSDREAHQRLASQWPIDEKVRHAHHVIDTSGTVDDTDAQVERLWRELTAPAGDPSRRSAYS